MALTAWTSHCTGAIAGQRIALKYETFVRLRVTEKEMKALLVLLLSVLAAATALAYGRTETAEVATLVEGAASSFATEPVVLLLSGALLLAIAGAVRRMPV